MSKVFSYDYKEELVKKLQKRYQKELLEMEAYQNEQEQLDEAEKIIKDYFKNVEADMQKIIQAAKDDISLTYEDPYIVSLIIHQNYIKITRTPKSIEVKVGHYAPEEGMVISEILGYIVPGDKKCKIKKIGKVHEGGHFDSNSINFYMREAFGHID